MKTWTVSSRGWSNFLYEIFEHTADLGLRIRAEGLNGLFEEAACAMFSLIVTDPAAIRPVQQRTFEITGRRHDELLRDWLAELLYTFHSDHMLLARFRADVRQTGLKATAWGEPFDPDRHEIDAELKAVTYHGLKVEQDQSGYLAEVVVDI